MTHQHTNRLKNSTAMLGYILIVAATVCFLAIGLSLAGAAEEEDTEIEFANSTVEFEDENDTAIVDIHWLDDATEGETATIEFYDETEYADDPDTAEPVHDAAVEADPGNTTSDEFDTSTEGLELETEYRVIVTADETNVEDAEISMDGDGGAVFASDTQRNGAAAVVIVIAAALLLTREE